MPTTPDMNAYFRVDGGSVLQFCEDWRRYAHETYDAMAALAEKYGSSGYVTIAPRGAFAGLHVVDPVPPGWEKTSISKDGMQILKPADGPEGAVVQAEIDALPRPPQAGVIDDFLAIPKWVVGATTDGRTVMAPIRNNLVNRVDMAWGAKDSTLLLRMPDPDVFVAAISDKNPGIRINQGRWEPPAGLTRITRAEFEAIYAEDAEREDEALAKTAAPEAGARRNRMRA